MNMSEDSLLYTVDPSINSINMSESGGKYCKRLMISRIFDCFSCVDIPNISKYGLKEILKL